MASDPPYGVNYDPAWRNRAGVSATDRTGAVSNDHRADWREAWALFPGDVAYVWHAGRYSRIVAESLEACGFAIRSQIIWAKSRLVLGRGDYHYQHEPCFYAVREGKTGHWQGARDQTTLWSIATRGDETEDPETVHGTQKPMECMRRPILNNSAPGDAIYEPFSGSGTTLIAAEMTGRRCLAMEIDPAYCDVAVQRWQDLTGKLALLDGDHRSFGDLEAERTCGDAAPAS
jgi:DNA modification methylase